MLDFDDLDAALEQAVGVAPDPLLRAVAPRWADRFLFARERMSDLSEEAHPSTELQVERDRLASYFGCAYGERGLLARAGALHTVHAKLLGMSEALPALSPEPGALGALRREALILSALADARLSSPPHPDDAPLRIALAEVVGAVGALGGFAQAAMQAERSAAVSKRSGRLYGAADLVNVASDIRDGLPVAGALAFVLGRLADAGFTHEARSLCHELCLTHADGVRDSLWRLGLSGFARRGSPASLRELRDLDLALEAVKAELCSEKRAAGQRVQAVSALYLLLALGQVSAAQSEAHRALDGTLLLLAEGLAAESKPAFPKPGQSGRHGGPA